MGDSESTPLLSDRMRRSLSEGTAPSTPIRSSTRSNSNVNLLSSSSRERRCQTTSNDEVTPSNLGDEFMLVRNGKIDSSIGDFSHLTNIKLRGRGLSGICCWLALSSMI